MNTSSIEIKLCEPHGDKGWSFQVFATNTPPILAPDIRDSLVSLIRTPLARKAKPFLQGDCVGWLMVEFWTDNESDIAMVSAFLERSLT